MRCWVRTPYVEDPDSGEPKGAERGHSYPRRTFGECRKDVISDSCAYHVRDTPCLDLPGEPGEPKGEPKGDILIMAAVLRI